MTLPVNAVVGVLPMRYDVGTDELVPVTQEWVTQVQKDVQHLGQALEVVRALVKLRPEQICQARHYIPHVIP